MNIDRAIGKAASAQASKDSKAFPKAALRREKSMNEANAVYRPVGTGLHFCFHDKSYYQPCTKCRRSKRDAQRNLSSL